MPSLHAPPGKHDTDEAAAFAEALLAGAPAALALLHVSIPTGAQVRIKHGDTTLLADVHAVAPAV